MYYVRVVAAGAYAAFQQDLLTCANDAAPFQLGVGLDLKGVDCGGACLLQPAKSCEDQKPRGRDYLFILCLLVMLGL